MFLIEIIKTVLVGIVQGITEWLPVSSTGHMILLNDLIRLDVSDAFWEMFEVVIQLGSILAVIVLYFKRLNPFGFRKNIDAGNAALCLGSVGLKKDTLRLWMHVLAAALPAAVVGVLFDDWFNAHFYNSPVVASALVVYGVLFILMERLHQNRSFRITRPEDIGYKTALGIGCFQVLSLIPGTSRSGSTILGASLLSVSRGAAAEFSFFLAVPVMLGASLLKCVGFAADVAGGSAEFGAKEITILLVGCATAFIVSVAAIRFLMDFVKKHSFAAFGVYRIILGAAVLAFWFFQR